MQKPITVGHVERRNLRPLASSNTPILLGELGNAMCVNSAFVATDCHSEPLRRKQGNRALEIASDSNANQNLHRSVEAGLASWSPSGETADACTRRLSDQHASKARVRPTAQLNGSVLETGCQPVAPRIKRGEWAWSRGL